jgi:hypothetical protein
VNRDIVEQILRGCNASRRLDTNPELEAVRAAILLEDVCGIALSDLRSTRSCSPLLCRGRSGRPPPGSRLMWGVCGIVSYDGHPDLTLLRRMMGRLGKS